MILRGVEATKYLARPDPKRAGLLIFGVDIMRVALERQSAILALIGAGGAGEMRLTRIAAADLRRDPALVSDAMRATGFFPGPRVALVEDATDGLTATLEAALHEWRPGDAQIIVAAGALTAKSTLKTLFEKHLNAVAIGLYDDPPSRAQIEDALTKAGLRQIDPAAMADVSALANELEPGDFRQMLEKLALYKWGDPTPLTPAEIALLAPGTIEAEVDTLLNAVADAKTAAIGPLIRRLEAQGAAPVTLCIGAERHFRALHIAASDAGGIASGLARARVFGPRSAAMQRQAQNWGVSRLEEALALLMETDLGLRSSARAPAMAVMERALIRLAMMRRAAQ